MNVNPPAPEIRPTSRYPLGSLRFLTHPVQRYLLAVMLVGLAFLAQSALALREVGTAPMLEPSVAIHVYRIMQECVSNSIKHGKPTSIIMESCSEESAHVFTVRDNGQGFHNKPLCNGMGLNIMEYRARVIRAQIEVTSPAEGGCLVTCRRPS